MVVNFPAPYAIELQYQNTQLEHSQLLAVNAVGDVALGTPTADIDFVTNSGGTLAAHLAIEDYLAAIAHRFYTDVTFNVVNIWKYVPESYERDLITAYTPVTTTGGSTGTGSTKGTRYVMLTYRTLEGGIMKQTFLEPYDAFDGRIGYGDMGASDQALVQYMLGDDGFVIGRDTSKLIAFNKLLGGQNEVLWRKINRP